MRRGQGKKYAVIDSVKEPQTLSLSLIASAFSVTLHQHHLYPSGFLTELSSLSRVGLSHGGEGTVHALFLGCEFQLSVTTYILSLSLTNMLPCV